MENFVECVAVWNIYFQISSVIMLVKSKIKVFE